MTERVSKLELRRVRKGDEEMLVEIFREVFGVELGVGYWRWKYFDNPFGEPVMYVAVDGGRVVGEIGGILCELMVAGREVLAVQVVDIVILAEYRKGGPFFKLEKLAREEAKERGVSLSYAISTKRHYKITTRLLKYKGVSPIKRLIKILDPSPYLKKKMGPIGGVVGGAGKVGLKFLRPGRLAEEKGMEVRVITAFDPAFDELWERESLNHGIAVVRRTPYLKWRYIDSPMNDYRIIAVYSDKGLHGYMALGSVERNGVKRGRIVDVFVEKDNKAAAGMLLNNACEYFYEEGCTLIATWVPESSWLTPLFIKAKFVSRDTPHDIIVRPEVDDYDIDYLSTPENWYLTMGDSDYF